MTIIKTLLCAINSKYIHSNLSVWCLAAGIEKYAPSVEYDVLECTINESYEQILSKIIACDFDMIGISTYIWNVELVLRLTNDIKKLKGSTIILGGPEVSYNSIEILEQNPSVDYIISGEGEESFAQLVLTANPKNIPGVTYRKSAEIVYNPERICLDDPPSPYTKRYFESLNGRISYIETSRGCPFKCAFCLSGVSGGVRFFDEELSKRNIISLANSGSKTIKFVDRTFNADKKRANRIFQFLIDNYGKKVPESVCFHFEIAGELIDDDTLETLEKAPKGLFQFEIGLQSFNEKTLEHINRKTNIEKLSKNIEKLIALGNIHIHIDLIVGMSYENISSFANSFNKALALNPNALQIGFLKLLHGAEMRENREKHVCQFSSRAPYEIIENPWLSAEELEKLHFLEDVFEKMYNSKRFPDTCRLVFSQIDDTFQYFYQMGIAYARQKIPNNLDDFTKFVFDFTVAYTGIDKALLRDKMALDRLSTNKMGCLPEFLKIHSPIIKKELLLLDKNKETKRKKGIKRSATVLLTESKLAYVDYDTEDKIKKSYKIREKVIQKDEN